MFGANSILTFIGLTAIFAVGALIADYRYADAHDKSKKGLRYCLCEFFYGVFAIGAVICFMIALFLILEMLVD